MGADLSPLVPYAPFDLMVYLSALPIRFVELVDGTSYETSYAIVRGRLPRRGLADRVYNGWNEQGHELVVDLGAPGKGPRYYGENARDLAWILSWGLRQPEYATWRTRIYRALGTTPDATEEGSRAHEQHLYQLGFERLQRGAYVYMQARWAARRRARKS